MFISPQETELKGIAPHGSLAFMCVRENEDEGQAHLNLRGREMGEVACGTPILEETLRVFM